MTPARDHAYGLRVYGVLARVRRHDPALGLGDDLRGDQQDVPVPQVGRGHRDQFRQVVARPDLGYALDGPYLVGGNGRGGGVRVGHREASASSSAARAISAVASRSVIISGTARQEIPAASTSATASASAVSTSQPSSSPVP